MPRLRGRAAVFFFNALWTGIGLSVVVLAAEGWARSKAEFEDRHWKYWVHPQAGRLYVPGSEVRHTNLLDFRTISHANRWGFLDRPPGQVREPSCRVAVVGDSFVDAKQVAVSDKLHVRLEELARERLPALRIAASAFGHAGTGQVNQLGWYDPFVSRISPHVVVLVFVQNDFTDNFHVLQEMWLGSKPGRLPFTTARRNADSTFSLRRPVWGAADLAASGRTAVRGTRGAPEYQPTSPWLAAVRSWAVSTSRFALLLDAKVQELGGEQTRAEERTAIAQDARFRHWFADWNGPLDRYPLTRFPFRGPDLPKAAQEALERTGFALDQWKSIAQRDNFVLAILASHTMGARGGRKFDYLESLTLPRNIPVIDQSAYIGRQGARPADARFDHDAHWNAAGHQWAAEAVLEWLEENREACTRRASAQEQR